MNKKGEAYPRCPDQYSPDMVPAPNNNMNEREMETKAESERFIKEINKTEGKENLSDEELSQASGGKCWFWHNYEIVYPTYYCGEWEGARFRCKDCGESIWAKRNPAAADARFREITYDEFVQLFGSMM